MAKAVAMVAPLPHIKGLFLGDVTLLPPPIPHE